MLTPTTSTSKPDPVRKVIQSTVDDANRVAGEERRAIEFSLHVIPGREMASKHDTFVLIGKFNRMEHRSCLCDAGDQRPLREIRGEVQRQIGQWMTRASKR